jgi:hypothetical protein
MRPSIRISSLNPLHLDLTEDKNVWILCADCGQWADVQHGLVRVHLAKNARCTGSKQRLIFDLTLAQHAARRNRTLAVCSA